MKTNELVMLLKEADPSGEVEVVVGGEDIYFVERLPAYHDGLPTLLVHDPALVGREWSVVGLRVPAGGEEKVRITTLGPADVFESVPDAPVEYGDDHARSRMERRIEGLRAEAKRVAAGVDDPGLEGALRAADELAEAADDSREVRSRAELSAWGENLRAKRAAYLAARGNT